MIGFGFETAARCDEIIGSSSDGTIIDMLEDLVRMSRVKRNASHERTLWDVFQMSWYDARG